ncbi:hypothetical protein BX600DRAFT_528180 [Xylariales sp. PMI_506]|nr:hypothetical protein BX600DRAFT_528180 [Xylariales sp. PMI_506]
MKQQSTQSSSISHGPRAQYNDPDPAVHPIFEWTREIVSVLVGFGCLSALVVILLPMHNQPLLHWTFPITINAVVAIFITASKVAAMFSVGTCLSQSKWDHFTDSSKKLRDLDLFEGASRGPFGSFHLLFQTRFNIRLAFVLGATATVLALGVDTFGQLVVNLSQTHDIEINDSSASFGLSHGYNSGVQSRFSGEGSGLMPNASTIDTAMEGAIYKAIFNVKTQPAYNCASRCIWKDSYVSLGFSAQCSNVTYETQSTIQPPNQEQVDAGQHWYTMTTPGNISLSAGYSQMSWLTLANVVAVDLLSDFRFRTPVNGTTRISSDFARIAVLIGPVDNVQDVVQNFYPGGWEIFECTVGIAVYNYSDISASGNQLTIGSTVPIPLASGELFGTTLTFSQPGLPAMTVQGVDLEALNDFYTSSFFSGYTFSGDGPPGVTTGIGGALRKADVPMLFDSMAQSMTEHLRTSYTGVIQAQGIIFESVVSVQVRWQWLSLPIFIQLAAAYVLAYTIWSNSRAAINNEGVKRPLWKTSVVAVLFHEVVPEGGSRGIIRTDVHSLRQLEKLKTRTWATMED